MNIYYRFDGLLEAHDLVSGKVLLSEDCCLHTLDQIPRFMGQTNIRYSVLDHSVLCGIIALRGAPLLVELFPELKPPAVRKAFGLAALYHDFGEAVMNDVAAPVKVELPEYKKADHELSQAYVKRAWGVAGLIGAVGDYATTQVWEALRYVDQAALLIEARRMLPGEASKNIELSSSPAGIGLADFLSQESGIRELWHTEDIAAESFKRLRNQIVL